jgi:hypothetical protein
VSYRNRLKIFRGLETRLKFFDQGPIGPIPKTAHFLALFAIPFAGRDDWDWFAPGYLQLGQP